MSELNCLILSIFSSIITYAYCYNMAISLSFGIISIALSLHDLSFIDAFKHIFYNFKQIIGFRDSYFDYNNILVFIFLMIIGAFVNIIQNTKEQKHLNIIVKYIKKPWHLELFIFILSIVFSIDDYLSCILVGAILKSMASCFSYSKQKMAIKIDSMSAPLSIMNPFSSWGAAISSIILSSTTYKIENVHKYLFYTIIPYNFYSIMIVIDNIISILNTETDKTQIFCSSKTPDKIFFLETLKSLIAPFSMLFSIFMFVFLIPNTCIALVAGSIVGLFFMITILHFIDEINIKKIPKLSFYGSLSMLMPIILLCCAWTFGSFIKDVFGGMTFLGNIKTLPLSTLGVVFFIISSIISTMIGSSWSTFAIIFPILFNLVKEPTDIYQNFIFYSFAATVSGGVLGDHLSPVSDTTTMSSVTIGLSYISHFYSQLKYYTPLVLIVIFGFYLGGITLYLGKLGWLITIFTCTLLLFITRKIKFIRKYTSDFKE